MIIIWSKFLSIKLKILIEISRYVEHCTTCIVVMYPTKQILNTIYLKTHIDLIQCICNINCKSMYLFIILVMTHFSIFAVTQFIFKV